MKTQYLAISRNEARRLSAEMPCGDPFGGAPYGEKNGPWAMVASAVVSAIGAMKQGDQAKEAADYNAAVANNNAVATRQQAEANAASQQRKARLTQGAMRAGYGASGVSVEGTPMDVLEQSASMAELDRQNILYGGAIKAQGYESSAGLELMRGENAKSGSYLNAASSMLSSASKMGSFSGGSSGVQESSIKGDTLYFDDYNVGSNLDSSSRLRRVG